jgi:hypothetical protein
MKRRAKPPAAAKSDDSGQSDGAASLPRARMAISGPDIGTEYDSKGNPVPLRERLPENQEKVAHLIAQAAAAIEK